MRLAIVQSATTVRLEGATSDSKVWRSAVPLVAGDLVAVETFGTQLVVVSALESPRVGMGAGLAASTSQSIANSTVTQMSFPVAAWDDDGWIDGDAIVTPCAGRYLLTASAQFDGGNAAEVAAWCGGKVESATCHGDGPPYLVMIDTLEGRMAAGRDDFVIRGVQGEFYPCKPDIFAATYEPADADDHAQPEGETRE